MVVNFAPRDVGIYRPYPDETPWPGADLDWTRVAKLDGAVVGAYELKRVAATAFSISALCVAPHCRGRGLGAWLLGHAIGTAESQGARRIEVVQPNPFYERHGFQAQDGRLALTLTPE